MDSSTHQARWRVFEPAGGHDPAGSKTRQRAWGNSIVEAPMRVLLASLVALGLFAPAGLAGETPVGKVVLDLWDAAYLQGGRAGHVHTFVEEFERDGEKPLRTTVELRLKVKRFSDTVELGMDSGDVATADGK